MTVTAWALFLLAPSIVDAAAAPNLDRLLNRHAAARAAVVSVSGRIDVRMTHTLTARPGITPRPASPPERFSMTVKALREPGAAVRALKEGEDAWIVEVRGLIPAGPTVRYAARGLWTRSANGDWVRAPASLDPRVLRMLAAARGWAYQYLEDAPEHWPARARVNVLSGAHPFRGKPAWLLEILPGWRLMQTALAARWEVVMSYDGLPLFSRSTDRAGRDVTVVDSREWRIVNGLPVSHEFTITVCPPGEQRPDSEDPVTTLECRMSGVSVNIRGRSSDIRILKENPNIRRTSPPATPSE